MPYPVKGLLEVYEDMVEILLMLQVFLAENPEVEYLFCGVPSGSETCLLFCNDLFCILLYKNSKRTKPRGQIFPADGYQAILNKLNKKSKTNRKWMGKWMDIEKQAAF